MNPDEIAALLALPTPVREALAKCAGPGWYVRDGHEAVGALRYGGGMANPGAWAWCPCDTAEILALIPRPVRLESYENTRDEPAWRAVGLGFGDTVVARGSSARLAALRLLGRVSA